MEKVIVYIDGFNLYYGIRQMKRNDLKWLDLELLSKNILIKNQKLIEVKYFTARVRNEPNKEKRQNTYIEALLEHTNVKIYYGHYQPNNIECYGCGRIYSSPNEKMTDVNIAVEMLIDAIKNRYDKAILISGDSDLIPPIRAIHNQFPKKRVTVVFPPKRHNQSVAYVAKGSFMLGRKKIQDSQLPEKVKKKGGYVLTRPVEWKYNKDK